MLSNSNFDGLNRRISPRKALKGINRIHALNIAEESGGSIFEEDFHDKLRLKSKSKFDDRFIFFLLISIFILMVIIGVILVYFLVINNDSNMVMPEMNYPNNIIMEKNEFYIFFNKYLQSLDQHRSVEFIVNDLKYYLPKKELVEEFVKNNKVENMKYAKDKNDCDNFSFILYGNFLEYIYKYNISYSYLFGMIYGYKFDTDYNHMFNFFVDDNHTVYCIEPQSDKIDFCGNFGYIYYRLIV